MLSMRRAPSIAIEQLVAYRTGERLDPSLLGGIGRSR